MHVADNCYSYPAEKEMICGSMAYYFKWCDQETPKKDNVNKVWKVAGDPLKCEKII